MKNLFLIRADAGLRLGGGHVVRTLALGRCFLRAGHGVKYATRSETLLAIPFLSEAKFEILELSCAENEEARFLSDHFAERIAVMVVDHYERGASFEAQCRDFANIILALDDVPVRPHDCDILLDQSLGRTPEQYKPYVPSHCQILTGPGYALLRPEFAEAREALKQKPRKELRRLLVMMGASDPEGVTSWVLEALSELEASLNIDVIGGGLDRERERTLAARSKHRLAFHRKVSDVASFMKDADLAIGTAGSASWERCCLGLPALLFVIADNQLDISRALNAEGVAKNLGWFGEMAPTEFRAQLTSIITDPDWLTIASEKAYELCDGIGTERVVKVVQEVLDARKRSS